MKDKKFKFSKNFDFDSKDEEIQTENTENKEKTINEEIEDDENLELNGSQIARISDKKYFKLPKSKFKNYKEAA